MDLDKKMLIGCCAGMIAAPIISGLSIYVGVVYSNPNREHYDYNRKHEDPAIIVANVGNITGISLLVGSTAAALGYSFKREFLDRRNQ